MASFNLLNALGPGLTTYQALQRITEDVKYPDKNVDPAQESLARRNASTK